MADEFDDAFDEIALFELQKALDEITSEGNEAKQKHDALKAQLAEISKQYNLLSREQSVLENERLARERKKRELEKELASQKRLKEIADQKKSLTELFEAKSKELDELTASAKWREFAFDHQITGGKELAIVKRGILGDKRGLGKTLTSLIWADMVEAKRILVLAPNDVVPQFEGEIQTWAPNRTVFSLRGLDKKSRDMIYPMLNMVPEFIVTLNYEAWRKDKTIIDDLIKAGLDTIILDEAHRIKGSSKQTAKGVFQIAYAPNKCEKCNVIDLFTGPWRQDNGECTNTYPGWQYVHSCGEQLVSSVVNVLSMTGTPILNKPQELFSLLHLVDHVKFASERNYLRDYCYKAGTQWIFLTHGLKKLVSSMSHFFIQRDRDSVGIQVPPPAITVHRLDKEPIKYAKQYEAEEAIHNAARLQLAESDEGKDIFHLLELITRERQVMTWPAGIRFHIKDKDGNVLQTLKFDVEESQKVDAAEELLEELLEEGERVVVFSQFVAPLQEMHKRFLKKGYKSTTVVGGMTDVHKNAVRNDFDLKTAPPKGEEKYQVVFATYKAFGTGINLNAARHMILLDDEWNPGMEDQAIGRIDRMNSIDQANVHIFRVNGSIDDFMEKVMARKRAILEGFNEETELATGLNELRKFFEG